ncbi:MAG: M1 family peptidase, partial [Fimbriimonadaceae bacterium]|nr:M1 family peptidase [Chitinophagales bacterium]
QWGSGTNIPFESSLMIAGANQETLLENKYTRAVGFFPENWTTFSETTNHFHAGGGLNLRGYAGYFVAQQGRDSTIYAVYSGTSGASINAELEFDRLINKRILKFIQMTPYLFFDAGSMVYEEANGKNYFSDIRMDAGIGSTFSWTWWGQLEDIKPFTVRIDLPLFLTRPPFEEVDYLMFRYIIGINRAF